MVNVAQGGIYEADTDRSDTPEDIELSQDCDFSC